MTTRSPRVDGMLPCGACRTFIDAITGCEHWGPNALDLTERVRPKPTVTPPSEHKLTKIMAGITQRTLLVRAALDPLGQVRTAGDSRLTSAAGRLVRAGLLESTGYRTAVYAITDAGREVFERIKEFKTS